MYLHDVNLEHTWALDIEADSLTPSLIWCVCVHNTATGEKHDFLSKEEFHLWEKSLGYYPNYVTHNGICFDIPVLNRLWDTDISLDRVIDTLVLSYLYNPQLPKPLNYRGKKGPHSLDCWGSRLRCAKGDFNDFSKLSEEMLVYCRQDAALTAKLYVTLSAKMCKIGYSELSAKIEHQFRAIIFTQETNGFKFDRLRANMVYLRLRQEEYKLTQLIQDYFGTERVIAGEYQYKVKKDGSETATFLRHTETYPEIKFNKSGTKYRTYKDISFNVGSPVQRIERLLALGWVPSKKTKTGNHKVDEESILEYYETSGNEHIGFIAKWLVLNGRANMVRTWLNNLDRSDDTIRGKVFSCGAQSRRCTHSSPNTANIPGVDAQYGKDVRSLWISRRDRALVGIDAKSLEGLIFAHLLGGQQEHIDYMTGGTHVRNAEALTKSLGILVNKPQAKTTFYAYIFGAFPPKLGSVVGLGAAAGDMIIKTLGEAVPGLQEAMDKAQREWEKNNGRLECIDGGYVLCPAVRAALNYKAQPGGAVFMKQAAILFDQAVKNLSLDTLKVGDIHDEWQQDTHKDHAEIVGQTAVSCMEEAGRALNLLVPMSGSYAIGRNWAETH